MTLQSWSVSDKFGAEYLSKEDWQELEALVRDGYEPSRAASLLVRAHETFKRGDLKQALIDAVTALEAALVEHIDIRLADADEPMKDCLGKLKNSRSIGSKLAAVALAQGGEITRDLQQAFEGITTRNKIVHNGYTPQENDWTKLIGLCRTIGRLIPGPRCRFPTNDGRSQCLPPDSNDGETRKDTAEE